MKRLFAIALFVAGGFATEFAHPLQCSLIQASGVQLKRRDR
ncbi:hypothetical protein [Paraburkholderia translucens]|nr:hypothetical protein [Paraburkholderia sp. MMS20-SJTN17]